jgi:hypothetical protein
MPLYLDHIIILLPYSKLLALPAWIPKNFAVTPGGRHADGKTENRLICFEDGTYVELIAFIGDDPKLREGHVSATLCYVTVVENWYSGWTCLCGQ